MMNLAGNGSLKTADPVIGNGHLGLRRIHRDRPVRDHRFDRGRNVMSRDIGKLPEHVLVTDLTVPLLRALGVAYEIKNVDFEVIYLHRFERSSPGFPRLGRLG
jgi:hypothetical protein